MKSEIKQKQKQDSYDEKLAQTKIKILLGESSKKDISFIQYTIIISVAIIIMLSFSFISTYNIKNSIVKISPYNEKFTKIGNQKQNIDQNISLQLEPQKEQILNLYLDKKPKQVYLNINKSPQELNVKIRQHNIKTNEKKTINKFEKKTQIKLPQTLQYNIDKGSVKNVEATFNFNTTQQINLNDIQMEKENNVITLKFKVPNQNITYSNIELSMNNNS